MNKKEKSALFIGSTSLLRECMTVWMKVGFRIDAVISQEKDIISFCQKRSLAYYSDINDFREKTDYIFSIANDKILPISFIRQAICCAINYHSVPSPRYAGMNSWSWAILNNEDSWGVTSHDIDDGIDTGDIIEQGLFKIDSYNLSQDPLLKCAAEALNLSLIHI